MEALSETPRANRMDSQEENSRANNSFGKQSIEEI